MIWRRYDGVTEWRHINRLEQAGRQAPGQAFMPRHSKGRNGLFALLLASLLASGCAIGELRMRMAADMLRHQPNTAIKPPQGDPAPMTSAETVFVREYDAITAVMARQGDTFAALAARHLGDPAKGWWISEFNDLERPPSGQAIAIPKQPPWPGGMGRRSFRTLPVLAYHSIARHSSNDMAVSLTEFERQMAYLKREGYQALTMPEVEAFLSQQAGIPRKSVLITFDDGWRSTYTLAMPVLRRLGMKATLFVYTDMIGTARGALNWNQVEKLHQSGVVDIQCHSKSHRDLRMHPEESPEAYFEALQRELEHPRQVLQKRLGRPCRHIAYPFGAQNAVVTALARELGYRLGFTVRRGVNAIYTDPFRLRRGMIYPGFSMERFANNLRTSRPIQGLPAPAKQQAGVQGTDASKAPGQLLDVLAANLERLAAEDAARGEYGMEAHRLEALAALRPEDATTRKRLTTLRSQAAAEATQREKRGIRYAARGGRWGAFREYLIALSNDPQNPGLLNALRPLAQLATHAPIRLVPGDTPGSIAEAIYHDTGWAPMVAALTHLPLEEGLASREVRLPKLDDILQKEFPGMKEKMEEKQKQTAEPAPTAPAKVHAASNRNADGMSTVAPRDISGKPQQRSPHFPSRPY